MIGERQYSEFGVTEASLLEFVVGRVITVSSGGSMVGGLLATTGKEGASGLSAIGFAVHVFAFLKNYYSM